MVRTILGVVLTLVGVVALYMFVLPKSKDGNFSNPFLQQLHDFFLFKKLYIESVIRFLYVVATVFCIANGFVTLFGKTFFAGLGMMIFGPIAVRITFEFAMMTILLIKNVIEINNKLK
ncbi:MAG: hypothetical protein ACI4AQ_00150 [Lachnospiraceae bacterium]